MAACKRQTIDGFNAYLAELKLLKDECRVTFRQFDADGTDTIFDAAPLEDIQPLTEETFVPRGWTPLYDAMGTTMVTTAEQSQGSKVLFVVLTDGQENASRAWTYDRVHEYIKEREKNGKWTFVYIGMGTDGFRAVQILAQGTQSVSNVMRTDADTAHVMYTSMARCSNSYRSATNANAVTAQFWVDTNAPEKPETK